jgi:hypothetical protein
MRPRITMHSQRSTEREEIPEGPPIDEELHARCMNAHDFYCENVDGYILKGVHYPKTFEELVRIVRSD